MPSSAKELVNVCSLHCYHIQLPLSRIIDVSFPTTEGQSTSFFYTCKVSQKEDLEELVPLGWWLVTTHVCLYSNINTRAIWQIHSKVEPVDMHGESVHVQLLKWEANALNWSYFLSVVFGKAKNLMFLKKSNVSKLVFHPYKAIKIFVSLLLYGLMRACIFITENVHNLMQQQHSSV